MKATTKRKESVFRKIGYFFSDKEKLEPTLVIIFTALFSILLGVGLIFLVSKDPVQSARNFVLGPFMRTYNIYYLIIAMVPLIFTGLALCIIYQLHYMSLIVDSSFYMGAVIATAIGVNVALPAGVHPLLAMILAGLVGGLIGILPAILRIKWRANELVSSLMLNYVFYFVGSYIILYFLRDRNQAILASLPFRSTFALPKLIPNTQLHAGVLIAILFIVLVSIFLYKTRWGYQIRVTGANPRFAAYAGIPVATVVILAHFISGFIGGVGGAVEMAGLYRAFIWQTNPSYAWDGVIVAMLAKRNPKYVPLSAFFLAYLRVGADFMSRRGDVAFEFVTLLQGFIILILASDKISNSLKIRRLRKAALASEQESKARTTMPSTEGNTL
ncbi:MAG TPA: ABC transporter permease [Spirochaetales bacterium]|nr:ABC transporter permease [Spirochaetales bacterium]